MALTRRQREILDFIQGFIAQQGYSPSLEEIGANFHLSSVATVHKHVQRLVEKKLLTKGRNRSRSVEPVNAALFPTSEVPLLGVVAAGAPIEAVEISETIPVPRDMLPRSGACFALRVRGDSMVEEGIRDGDTVIVESGRDAADGDTVVALVRGHEVTLKKLQRKGERVLLLPANAALRPLELPAREVASQGVGRDLLRR
jgi:repressor LexA